MVSFNSLQLFKIPGLKSFSRKFHIWTLSGTVSIHCFGFLVLFLCFSCVWTIVSHSFSHHFFVENCGHFENYNVATLKSRLHTPPNLLLLIFLVFFLN